MYIILFNDGVLDVKWFANVYHLVRVTGWAVDQAILAEEDRVVVLRFGHDEDPTCMAQDEILCDIAESVKLFAVIYLVDISEVKSCHHSIHLCWTSTAQRQSMQ